MKSKVVESYPIEPKYKKENGLYLQDIDRTDLPFGFSPISRSLVTLPPNQVGGNHAHLRIEGFIGIGRGLEFHWLEDGEHKSELMNPDGQLMLFIVKSMIPHAIRNSGDSDAVLMEYADLPQEQSPVERVEVI